MPELPEVAVFKKVIEQTSLHQPIQSIEVERKDILEDIKSNDFADRLEGDQFQAVDRYGKYLFILTGMGQTIFMHFGMTARPVYYSGEDIQPDYARLVFTFRSGDHLAFDCRRMLGKVGMTGSMDQFVKDKGLGIDALDPKLDKAAFRELIQSSRGYVKTTLMKQETIAGIGNEMSDEILYQAGIHPKSKISGLDSEDINRIYDTMRKVFETRISTNAQTDQLPDTWLLKHRDDGEACPKCGGSIERVKISGRSSYVCEQCQDLK